jgi:hypothetical protein
MESTNGSGSILEQLFGAPSKESEKADFAPSEKSEKVKLAIHQQCPGIKLVSPVYGSVNATCYLSPDQNVVVGSTTQADFSICPAQKWSVGALMYELQRKNINQFNENTISGEEEEEATCIQLVITWTVDSFKKFYVASYLIEHDEDRVWNEDNLMKLIDSCGLCETQHGPIEETYLMYDDIVLSIRMNATHEEECYKLEMIISETSIKDDTRRLWHVDLDG